ncbi:MAG TPA: DUF4124 domain-containing protein [Nevskiaceae bacterium]|nr:DUF4124 domain-containing protein [Nevskiaceae bacterium]
MRLVTTVLLLALASATVAAPVYRYVDKDGVTHYTDKPPTPDAQPASLPPLQTISPSEPLAETPSAAAAPEAPAAQPPVALRITTPAADETFRGDDSLVTVSASSDRPLPNGVGLLYLLDGTAQNSAPVKTFTYTLQNVERGSHVITVAAVDGTGREVARSAPVTVHMKQPTIANAPTIPKPPTPPKPK